MTCDLRGVRPLAETVEPAGGVTDRLVILVDDVLFFRPDDPGRAGRDP